MGWRPPDDLQRGRQDRWRAGFIWGVFGVLVVAALGAQSLVPRALEVELGPQVQHGPLSVRVPAGWQVSERDLSTILAETGSAATKQRLSVGLLRASEGDSLIESLLAHLEDGELSEIDLEEVSRQVKVAGRPGLLVSFPVVVTIGGRQFEAGLTTLAFRPASGFIATVMLESRGEWNSAGQIIVQQVARTIRVVSEE